MNPKVIYEVVDMRDGSPLAGLRVIRFSQGGLNVFGVRDPDGRYEHLSWDLDDPESFSDDPAHGSFWVMTDEGRVIFEPLTMANWRRVEFLYGSDHPKFETEADLYRYLGGY